MFPGSQRRMVRRNLRVNNMQTANVAGGRAQADEKAHHHELVVVLDKCRPQRKHAPEDLHGRQVVVSRHLGYKDVARDLEYDVSYFV